MAKRAMTIAVLAVSLVLMGGMAVNAQNLSICCWGNSDIHGEAIFKGLRNANRILPAYEVVLILQELIQQCITPSGSDPETAQGGPHNPKASVSQQGQISDNIIKNGRVLVDLVFTDADIKEAVFGDPLSSGLCRPNWIEGDLVATALQAFGTLFECGGIEGADPNDPRGFGPDGMPGGGDDRVPCAIVDQVGQQLCAPQDQPLFQPENEFDYIFKTICDDNDKTAEPSCPNVPVEFGTEECPITP